MLDHVTIPVEELDRAAKFYDEVLVAIGYRRLKERDDGIGYGPESRRAPVFWILAKSPGDAVPGTGLHISFQAPTRDSVDEFYSRAIASGGQDAGQPGLRPQYTMPFYGAFIYDPDGYKIEAVCRLPD